MQNDMIWLRHMLDAVREVLEFTSDQSRKYLDDNRILALAIIKLLEVLGEAASGVSDTFKETHSDLPWNQMIGMRNRLIHGYFDVNLDIVWQTVHVDLPPLKKQLEDILD